MRKQLTFTPEWEGPIRNYAVSTARRQLWKVETPDFDLDDLMQEARICFWRCCQAYPQVTEPKHFFALFRSAFQNKIINLAAGRTRKHRDKAVSEVDPDHDLAAMVPGGEGIDEAYVQLMLEDAPARLARLVALTAKATVKPRRLRVKHGRLRRWETDNEFACRVAKQDPTRVDMIKMVRDWLNGEQPCPTVS
jgi:hypothetical protein